VPGVCKLKVIACTPFHRIHPHFASFPSCALRFGGYRSSFSGLLVDFAQQKNATVIVRGLRAISDYDYEAQMALVNRSLCEEIETFFLMSREEYSYVSSSVVREVAAYGGKVDTFVSPAIAQALRKKFEDAQGT